MLLSGEPASCLQDHSINPETCAVSLSLCQLCGGSQQRYMASLSIKPAHALDRGPGTLGPGTEARHVWKVCSFCRHQGAME